MSQLVNKPELGQIIGNTQDGKPIYASDALQNYLDEIQQILNSLILGDAIIFPVYTVATVPTASEYTNGQIAVSNETGGYTFAYSDGTNWRRVQDRTIIS